MKRFGKRLGRTGYGSGAGFTRGEFLKFGGALATAATVAPLASACGTSVAESGGSGAEYTMRLADSFPEGHPISVNGAEYFIERASELTDGRVEFDYFPAEQLGTADELIDFTRSEAVDIGMVSPAYIAAKLPLSAVGDLPALAETSREGSVAVRELMQEGGVLYREEFAPKGLRPLVAGLVPAYEVMTSDTLVKSPDDVGGLQLRSAGGAIDYTTTGIGAAPVAMPVTEMYEAISRGTVDGTMLSPVSALPYGLEEAARYSTGGAQLGNFTTTYSINERVWRELPDDIQEALLEAGEDTTRNLSAALDQENIDSRRQMEEGGMQFYNLSASEQRQWQEAVQPVQETWVGDMQDIGLPGEEALQAMTEALQAMRGQR